MKAVAAIAMLGCTACGGHRAPLVAQPLAPHANDHGTARKGPCLDGSEAGKIDLPPTLIGRIVGVYPDGIAVELEQAPPGPPAPVDVPISDGTVLCTIAGGAVRRPDLTIGLNVAVWLPSSKHPALGAVAVMLAGTAPGADWPDR